MIMVIPVDLGKNSYDITMMGALFNCAADGFVCIATIHC